MGPLILASTSESRKNQLQALGIPFEVCPPHCDEDILKAQGLAPRDLASSLARQKARSLPPRGEGEVVVGADQVVVHKGEILGKPATAHRARGQLRFLSAGQHELITSVCLFCPGPAARFYESTEVAKMTMAPLSDEQIDNYIQRDSPLRACGSYRIESRGVALFERIEVGDFTSITGLPMLFVGRTLRELGFSFP